MNQKKLLIFTLLTAILVTAAAVSAANAEEEEDSVPPLLGDSVAVPGDTPNLIATQNDNAVTAEQPPPPLDQTRDDATPTSDNSTIHTAEGNGGVPPEDAPNLIATQTAPSNALLIVETTLASLIAACAVAVAAVVSRHRKASV